MASHSPSLPEPQSPEADGFNPRAVIPFGLTTEHLYNSMKDFTTFLGFIDNQLRRDDMNSFEDMLAAANFNSMVGEFMARTIPRHCKALVRNNHRSGQPDLLPAGKYPNDSVKHAGTDGIEVQASRYLKSWQTRKAEDVWLMMFVFQSGRLNPRVTEQTGFRFLIVAGGLLTKDDWPAKKPSPRSFIEAEDVSDAGARKLMDNWIYKCKELR